jgi:multidrug efflux pump subunit AcrA (membrane-fusion protein)
LHILTKIFIVLVSLLAVMLTPLVVVFASNEGTFRTKFLEQSAKANAASAELVKANESQNVAASRFLAERTEFNATIAQLRGERDAKESDVRRVEAELAATRANQASMAAQLATLAAAAKADSELKELLVKDLRDEREKALSAEKRFIEIDERLRKTENDFATSEAARRDLQEQIRQIMDQRDRAMGEVNRYYAIFGKLPEAQVAAATVPDRDISSSVVNVRRSNDGVLAEIDAGSRDGVREGWVMTIADGENFIANLRIIKVDINRSTGVVELEDQSGRGQVRAGQRAFSRLGG